MRPFYDSECYLAQINVAQATDNIDSGLNARL